MERGSMLRAKRGKWKGESILHFPFSILYLTCRPTSVRACTRASTSPEAQSSIPAASRAVTAWASTYRLARSVRGSIRSFDSPRAERGKEL